jgi:hypothetical protein
MHSKPPCSSSYPAAAQVGVNDVPVLLPDLSRTGTEAVVAVAGVASLITFAAKPLTTGAPQISAPHLGLVLHAKPLATKPPDIGRQPPSPPGVHRLEAAPYKRSRKRTPYMLDLIRSVLLDRMPRWRECGFPTREEMPNPELQKKGWHILKQDPRLRALDLSWTQVRKSFWRVVGRL